MKKITVALFFLGIFMISGIQVQSTVNPFDEEWTSLFNGKDFSRNHRSAVVLSAKPEVKKNGTIME